MSNNGRKLNIDDLLKANRKLKQGADKIEQTKQNIYQSSKKAGAQQTEQIVLGEVNMAQQVGFAEGAVEGMANAMKKIQAQANQNFANLTAENTERYQALTQASEDLELDVVDVEFEAISFEEPSFDFSMPALGGSNTEGIKALSSGKEGVKEEEDPFSID